MKNKERIVLTEEQDIMLDLWYQWSYPTKRGRWSGGLSALLENMESYLKERKILNRLGNFNNEMYVRNPWL